MNKMALQKLIDETIGKITETYHPQKIIIFGSAVRGEVDENSDIDILIIKQTDEPPGKRWMTVGKLIRNLKSSIPFEPIILTPEELQQAMESGDMFIKEIFSTGKVIYDKAA